MSNNKHKNREVATEPVQEVVQESAELAVKPAQESVYSASELANNHKAFGTYKEIVIVALRQAGKETATFNEAKQIIETFKNKEVK